ncbi:GT2 family glycosyltransferase [Pararhizobium capsulatum DSM 1112]|uniref:GT2 family glycosyltransferase n=1 Tax=Pararhizobium capsulatum DSM 1112 TaxID=1121113 RepID=A0ABU0BS70_9HYPH|nr:glycosyltransferase family 2 protein [Pararhizobium capsulatum]MDQ0321106.1 GT2 family glycosyltransferase [Pararhizobium capsulatum DSM 1112]
MARASIIIPNWNGAHLLPACLEGLRSQTFRDFTILLVDNGSADGSVELLASRFPEVRVLRHTENLGFSAAINTGIAAGDTDYVVALNNDTEIDPGWLAALVETMDRHPDVGLATSKILDFRNRSIIDTVGDGYSLSGLSFKIGSRCKDDGLDHEPFDVFGASACAAIYRRSMLDHIGVFDVNFFAYMEDVDLSIRARLAGYRCLSVPAAKIYHMGSASTGGTASAFSVRLTTRNILAIIIKDIPLALLPQVLVKTTVLQLGALFQCLFMKRHPWLRRNLKAYAQGLGEAIGYMPVMIRQRREVQKQRRISTGDFKRLISDSERLRRHYVSRPIPASASAS